MIDLDQAFADMDVSGEAKRASWTLPRSLPYFDGHFPDNPIFPAVGIVDASVFALTRILDRAVTLESIQSAKFTQVIGPDQPVEISFEETGEAAWSVNWTLKAQTVATLSLRLRKES